MSPPPLPPEAMLMQLVMGKWVSMAISVVAKLRIADKLVAGPKSVEQLAAETQTHAPSLYRTLRALAGVGVFAENDAGQFQHTTMSEFLRTGVPGSIRGIADYCGSPWSWGPWGQMLDAVRTGDTSFNKVYGEPVFDYLAKHPDESAVFNEGMSGFSSVTAGAVAAAYDFNAFGTITDIGGGHGMLLTTVLKQHTAPKGIVFDSPHVVAGAPATIDAAGLSQRCTIAGGDFFQSVPQADLYMMRHILHDWNDERATLILKNCRTAARPGAKLAVVELVIPPGNEPSMGKILDLEMLVIASGRERTEAEYASLFAGAGWKFTRVVPTKSPVSIVEGVLA
jgi:hypothetical protein